MSRNEIRVTSFAALGRLHGIKEPKVVSEQVPFEQMPVLDQLKSASHALRDKAPQANRMRNIALCSVLEMDPREKTKQGIRVISFVPLDDAGNIVSNEVLSYTIYVTFPYFDKHRVLTGSNLSLMDKMSGLHVLFKPDPLRETNERVTRGAELYPEAVIDAYSRRIEEIKTADSLLKIEKDADMPTQRGGRRNNALEDHVFARSFASRTEELNHIKTERVLAFFQMTDTLMREYPHLSFPYRLEQNCNDFLHMRLVMSMPRHASLLHRLRNPQTMPELTDGRMKKETNVNVDQLKQKRSRFLQGSTDERDKVGAAVYEYVARAAAIE